jgi:hypothetical protein
MNGDHYSISGRPMLNLILFLEKETNVKLDLSHTALSCAPGPGVSGTDCDLSYLSTKLIMKQKHKQKQIEFPQNLLIELAMKLAIAKKICLLSVMNHCEECDYLTW